MRRSRHRRTNSAQRRRSSPRKQHPKAPPPAAAQTTPQPSPQAARDCLRAAASRSLPRLPSPPASAQSCSARAPPAPAQTPCHAAETPAPPYCAAAAPRAPARPQAPACITCSMPAAKRSRAACSSGRCTSRVRRLPWSAASRCVNSSLLCSSSHSSHCAASAFSHAMRESVSSADAARHNHLQSLVQPPPARLLAAVHAATKSPASGCRRWSPRSPAHSRRSRPTPPFPSPASRAHTPAQSCAPGPSPCETPRSSTPQTLAPARAPASAHTAAAPSRASSASCARATPPPPAASSAHAQSAASPAAAIPALRHRHHLPHQVSLLAPQVQRAALMLRVHRRLRRAQIEDHLAVFQHGSLRMLREELLHLLAIGAAICAALWLSGWSAEETRGGDIAERLAPLAPEQAL